MQHQGDIVLNFIGLFQSVVLSTLDDTTTPFGSYAPFVHHEHAYYVFISDIATHAKNLNHTPKAALFFIEDEARCNNIFARKRISMQCNVQKIAREDALFQTLMQHFSQKFNPEMIQMLQGMMDFNLYEFIPYRGEATFGFGEAYTLGGEHCETLLPRQERGHKKV